MVDYAENKRGTDSIIYIQKRLRPGLVSVEFTCAHTILLQLY